jgi:hypothetical protein
MICRRCARAARNHEHSRYQGWAVARYLLPFEHGAGIIRSAAELRRRANWVKGSDAIPAGDAPLAREVGADAPSRRGNPNAIWD